jgi:hypothetical protein
MLICFYGIFDLVTQLSAAFYLFVRQIARYSSFIHPSIHLFFFTFRLFQCILSKCRLSFCVMPSKVKAQNSQETANLAFAEGVKAQNLGK